jgi:RNA polymerase sigma factor (TIGR02999 family)
MTPPQDVTQLLVDASDGDRRALDRLLPLVYDELRKLAEALMQQERPDHTLQPTALVHEAYLRLVDRTRIHWVNRAHFYAVAAQAIRRVLVDHARGHKRVKRGRGRARISLDEGLVTAPDPLPDLLALDEALDELAAHDPQEARVVEVRFFGGLTIAETAEVLGISTATVERDWRYARARLYQLLAKETENGRPEKATDR